MTKKVERIKTAYREAERFMGRCDELFAVLEADAMLDRYLDAGVGNKESGAVRRASMDLTRALAEMRKQ